MASRVESAVKRAFGVDAHCAPNDDAIREVEAERYAVLAELRELEDCRLLARVRAGVHGHMWCEGSFDEDTGAEIRDVWRLYRIFDDSRKLDPLLIDSGKLVDGMPILTDKARAVFRESIEKGPAGSWHRVV